MKHVLVLGAGNIGSMISDLLVNCGDYEVTLGDLNKASFLNVTTHSKLHQLEIDVTSSTQLESALDNKFAVISACPYQFTTTIAKAAAKTKTHYFDLTEDVASTKIVKKLAEEADSAFIPQSGLAPGFVSIIANHIGQQFDELHDLHMRVGALPMYPSNALKYNLTWSTEGLINEYCRPCEALINGELIESPPLEEIESFSLDGITYEAFNTSGGLGTLCESLEGKVKNLNYKSVRYPGHRDMMKMLLQDLRLKDRQELLKEIFESSLPTTTQDVVLIFISASGMKNGKFVQDCYASKVYNQNVNGKHWGAIQVVTATSVCAVLDLLAEGKLPKKGFIRQEDISFEDFITNRFGKYYDTSSHQEIADPLPEITAA